MYSKINIYKTDFSNKYLLRFNDNSLYVGYIVREVVLLLKKEINKDSIPKIINEKHNLTVNDADIQKIIKNIEATLFVTKETSLIKLFKIINPANINVPLLFQNIFKEKTFYIYLFSMLLINIYAFLKVERVVSKSFAETVFLYIFLIFILISHELGHSIASKKYGVITNEIGFGFYSIFPVFYIDLGEVWRLSTTKRIIINLSGIFSQLLIGALLFTINTFINDNYLITNLIYINFIILLLNFNPFLKFDGYWVVSDLLKQRNLMNKSNELLKGLFSLKLPKEKFGMIFYIFLKLIFILWVIYNILNFIYKYTLKLLNNEFSNLNYIILIVIIGLLITKLIKKKI
ncbi:MAG: M50 family metallopeptidase [Urechidicola sp.]|nr:M50 family metallopeptidase [Urechidicola sp.]